MGAAERGWPPTPCLVRARASAVPVESWRAEEGRGGWASEAKVNLKLHNSAFLSPLRTLTLSRARGPARPYGAGRGTRVVPCVVLARPGLAGLVLRAPRAPDHAEPRPPHRFCAAHRCTHRETSTGPNIWGNTSLALLALAGLSSERDQEKLWLARVINGRVDDATLEARPLSVS